MATQVRDACNLTWKFSPAVNDQQPSYHVWTKRSSLANRHCYEHSDWIYTSDTAAVGLGGWLCENYSARLAALSNALSHFIADCIFSFSIASPVDCDRQSGGVFALDEA
jgi:hypothetical protein